MDEPKETMYLLNVNSRTIHNATSTDGRCRITLMQECNKKYFSSYQEAKNYLPKGKKTVGPCSFCLGADYEARISK